MSRFLGKIACDCGAPLTITSEWLTGRTIEHCAGCGYDGPARPRMDLPMFIERATDPVADPSDDTWPACIDGCGRRARTRRSDRCRECDREQDRARALVRMRGLRGLDPIVRVKLCVTCRTKPAYAPRALRCSACAHERHRTQLAAKGAARRKTA